MTNEPTTQSDRKISYPIYGLALVLSIIIFSIGIYIGSLIDQANQKLISDEVEGISQKIASTQLLMLLDESSASSCPLYQSSLESINEEVEKVGFKLSYLEDEKEIFDIPLKKSYFVLEAESYLLSQKIKNKCGDNSTLLVYFYSNKNCSSCKAQGNDILAAREEIPDGVARIKIYSFDGELGSPVADALKSQFNITEYPSIVVNGKLYSGAISRDALRSAMVES